MNNSLRDPRLYIGIALTLCSIGLFLYLAFGEKKGVTADPQETPTEKIDSPSVNDRQGAAIGEENLVTFSCADSKHIAVVFERDIAGITLSDGRQFTLRLARSDTGIRYLSPDASIELSGRGNDAELTEKGIPTYTACTAQE